MASHPAVKDRPPSDIPAAIDYPSTPRAGLWGKETPPSQQTAVAAGTLRAASQVSGHASLHRDASAELRRLQCASSREVKKRRSVDEWKATGTAPAGKLGDQATRILPPTTHCTLPCLPAAHPGTPARLLLYRPKVNGPASFRIAGGQRSPFVPHSARALHTGGFPLTSTQRMIVSAPSPRFLLPDAGGWRLSP